MAATIWKGHLTFGLVSIPIKLHRAARAEKVSFRHVYRRNEETRAPEPEVEPDPAPRTRGKLLPIRQSAPMAAPPPPVETVERVRQVALPQENDEPLEQREIVKGYEYEKDRYVLIDAEELKRLQPETAREMQLREFVRLEEIDPVYFESSYYAWPDRGGEKPYALLVEALRRSGYVGVAEVAMQRREHVVIVRPGHSGLVLHTMFYTAEIHAEDEYRSDTTAVSDRELEMAQLLIGNLAAPFEPEKYRDRYKERVEELIEAKLAGREIAQTSGAPAGKAPVTDMMEALRLSLEATGGVEKKPAASDKRKPRAKRA
jgi:DNA end-binding protein Ku